MLCATLLKARGQERRGPLFRASEWVFDRILGWYETSLAWVLRHEWFTLLVTLSTVGVTVYLYVIVPKGFFPQQDTGRISGNVVADQDVSFQAMTRLLKQFSDVVADDPAVLNVIAFTGGTGGGGGASNSGRMFATLKPLSQRDLSADQVIGRIRGNAARIPGATLFLQATQDLRIGGRSSSAQYQYTLKGDNLDELNRWGPRLLAAMRKIPGLVDVNTDQLDKGLQEKLVIDRTTAARLGVSLQTIDDTLYDAFGQRQVSTMYKPMNQYHVVMELEPGFGENPESLRHIYIRGPLDAQIPLNDFYAQEHNATALAVNHSGQFPSVTMSFNMAPGTSLGEVVPLIEEAANSLGLPESIQGKFQGTAQAFRDSLQNQPILILAALVAVYIVLGVLYESYIHPLTILSTLPSAGVGALLALIICRTELNVMALIGILLLIGIVKKNAIMMIDFALEAERKQDKPPEKAIFEACLLRFRPITMTTLAALLGGLPLALGTGDGAELRRPLGIAIVGGLIFSQMLTLYTTPVVYLFLDRLRLRFTRHRRVLSPIA
jgi:multidrug efflux pump